MSSIGNSLNVPIIDDDDGVPISREESAAIEEAMDPDKNVWEDDVCVEVDDNSEVSKKCLDFRVLWTYMGPGWLMSIAYLDPGNLEADLQAGAYAGYELLWVLMWCTFIGFILQVLAARLGVVTGRNLAQVCREEYGKKTVYLLWIMTELAIIGSDIQEVLGGAIALKVLFGLPLMWGTVIMAVSTFALLLLQRFGIRKVEAVFAVLIGVMIVAFWSAMSIAKPAAASVAKGVFLPEVESYAVTQAVGILGAVIMPHNIYLHSALVTSRKLNRRNLPRVRESLKYNAMESGMALFVSFLINLAVLATFAVSYFAPACAERSDGDFQACVPTAGLPSNYISPDNQTCMPQGFDASLPDPGFVCARIGLGNAGDALASLFPSGGAKIIWGVGLLAAGQASTITGTYAGQFVMAGFLNFQIKAWQRMFFTRMVALGPAVAVAWLTQKFPSISDTTNEYLNVLQSVQLPFALLPVLHLTSQKRFMGKFVNPTWLKVICWLLAVVVIATNIFLVYQNLVGADIAVIVLVCIAGAGYFFFLFVIVRSDVMQFVDFVRRCGAPNERASRSSFDSGGYGMLT